MTSTTFIQEEVFVSIVRYVMLSDIMTLDCACYCNVLVCLCRILQPESIVSSVSMGTTDRKVSGKMPSILVNLVIVIPRALWGTVPRTLLLLLVRLLGSVHAKPAMMVPSATGVPKVTKDFQIVNPVHAIWLD